MLKKIGTYLKEGNTFSSLEICELNGRIIYLCITIQKDKEELNIIRSERFTELKDVLAMFSKSYPLFLAINTSKVLTRQIAQLNSSSPQALVNHSFPNLDMNSFYYSIIQEKERPIITISKKEYINGLIAQFTSKGISLMGFSLGLTSINPILSYLSQDIISVSNFELGIENDYIVQINPLIEAKNDTYTLDGMGLKGQYLITFSNVLSHLSKVGQTSNFSDINIIILNEYHNNHLFKMITKVALVFFLILLLGNFLAFDHYHNKTIELEAAMMTSSGQRKQLEILNESVQRKQERVETLNASSNSKATFHLDQFAKGIPSSILMNEIIFQPLKKPVRENNPIELDKNSILVAGIASDNQDFSKWIEELEKLEWTSTIETMDYDYFTKERSNFLVKIGISENK